MAEKKYRSIDEITLNGIPLRLYLEQHHLFVESPPFKGSQIILEKEDLSRIDLSYAVLAGVHLQEVNLSEANLERANLRWAMLDGSNLRDADLRYVDLSMAKLFGVNVEGAIFGGTTIADCDLSDVKGLESVKHIAPSSIGIDTLFKSKGKIPEAFLKGAGVPDDLITYAKNLAANPIEYYRCFISHSAKDQEFCDRLLADLRDNGVSCWYFPEDATWGKTVWGEIDEAIKNYDKLVVVCSEQSLNSGPVIREIERALQKEDREKKDVLFPVRIDDYLFDQWEHDRKADVLREVVGDFRGWQDHKSYKKNFDKLLKALNSKQPDRP